MAMASDEVFHFNLNALIPNSDCHVLALYEEREVYFNGHISLSFCAHRHSDPDNVDALNGMALHSSLAKSRKSTCAHMQ